MATAVSTSAIDKPLLLLIDGHSLAFRSFYAFSKNSEGGLSTRDGVPTSVTYGFLKALLDSGRSLEPQGVVIAFDTSEPTFRHEVDANYKAHREVAPEIFFQDLKQLQAILSEQLDLSTCIVPGYEADDILGTLANYAANEGWRVRILSGDRDLFQLVDDTRDIAILYMAGGHHGKSKGPILIDEAGVTAQLGVVPTKVADLKALTGDSSDNISGIKGIGPKTAVSLLRENAGLDDIYAVLAELEAAGPQASCGMIKGSLKSRLAQGRDKAYLSRYLAKIVVDVPLPLALRLNLGMVDVNALNIQLKKLELNSLLHQVQHFAATFSCNSQAALQSKTVPGANRLTPASAGDFEEIHADAGVSRLIDFLQPQLITSDEALIMLRQQLETCCDPASPVSISTETTDSDPSHAELVGLGFCWGDKSTNLAYIPVGHHQLTGLTQVELPQLPLETVLNTLAPWLASNKHPKTLQNVKYDRLLLMHHGLVLEGVVVDTLLADYLRDSTAKYRFELVAEKEFNFAPTIYNKLLKKQYCAGIGITITSRYCAINAYTTRHLAIRLRQLLHAMSPQLLMLLEQVEQPLERVLAQMESTGVHINMPHLQELTVEMSNMLKYLEQKAKIEVGVDFNLASPKQLGELLFNTLGLDKKKSHRTKNGYSTNVVVLERLVDDHPVVPLVLEHRILSKLKSTYIDALPQLIDTETGRVHTDFNQAATATGRLSSSNPNLQNIPIRTDFSRRIRKAFLPQDGWRLVSADYSQIELRVLSHLSEEETLQEAYRSGDDVHALTAKLLLEKDEVSADERRLGKTINFGVIYGMGVQRLARETGISRSAAKDFLKRYRERYPKVFSFLELQERLALSRGYVETILGRRRPFNFDHNGLGRLLGKEPMEIDLEMARRSGVEAQQLRAAANAPIQGSSADIIKMAMVHLHYALWQSGLPAHLLLQVHDELVLESEPSVISEVCELVQHTMEQAVSLSVPLTVEMGIGNDWMEAKR